MGILDALFGSSDTEQQNKPTHTGWDAPAQTQSQPRPVNADEQALARYRYMLQTAPPEELEKAHEEAFARLTPDQRKLALQQMSMVIPESEARELSEDPKALARAATRSELRQPGSIERTFGGANQVGGGVLGSTGGLLAGSFLTSLAGSFIGSSIASSFFSNPSHEQAFQSSPEAQNVTDGVSEYNAGDFQPTGLDSSADPLGDPEATNFEDTSMYSNNASDGYSGDGFDGAGFEVADMSGDF